MMKQKILFALLAVVWLVGCGNEEEDNPKGIEDFYSNVAFAGVWNVSEVNIGGAWQDARTADYKDSQIIIAEDSCYQSFGRFGNCYGRYTTKGRTATCLDDYRRQHLVCQFKSISGNKATATITNKEGRSTDFHLERDDSNPALYLDPLKFLDGTWDIHNDEGGYVSIYGYSADIHHSKFNAGYEIYRSPADISSFKLGSGLTIRFDLSKTPYTLSIAGRCYELNGKYINITCTKRDE